MLPKELKAEKIDGVYQLFTCGEGEICRYVGHCLFEEDANEIIRRCNIFAEQQEAIVYLKSFETAVKKRHNGYDPEVCKELGIKPPESPEQALQELQDEWNEFEDSYCTKIAEQQVEIERLKKELCNGCIYLEEDKKIINEHIDKEIALDKQIAEQQTLKRQLVKACEAGLDVCGYTSVKEIQALGKCPDWIHRAMDEMNVALAGCRLVNFR